MEEPTTISIVVACRNETHHIIALLDSISNQDMNGLEWEVIIADGMSTDGTRELLDVYFAANKRVRVISNPGRIVSTGLNAAIRAARGEIILRMDAHTSYARDYCKCCVEQLRNSGAQNVGGPARTRTHGLLATAIAAAYHSPFSTGGARFHNPDFEGWVDTVPYGCWKKDTLIELGLFDENLVRNQDDELNLRLLRSGGKIWQSARIRSWYSPRPTISRLFHQYFQYGFWKVAVIRKHRIPGSWRHLVPAGFALTHIVLLSAILAAAILSSPSLAMFAGVWAAITGLYAVANLLASVSAARSHGWPTLLFLPLIFAAYHCSYGLGFLAGIFRFASKPATGFGTDSVFARISR